MSASFASLLRKLVRTGNLEVETAGGEKNVFGDGSGPRLGVRLVDRAAERELLMNPTLTLGALHIVRNLVVTRSHVDDQAAGHVELSERERRVHQQFPLRRP